MTGQMDVLADGANAITTTPVSNDAAAELDLYGDFQLYLNAQTAGVRETGAYIPVYILPEIDGNYAYGGSTLDPDPGLQVGMFSPDSGTTGARYLHMRQIELPPTDFHVLLMNETNRTFRDANVLKLVRYNLQSN
jgi:hypothetical protein